MIFQFKHCTIIRTGYQEKLRPISISIQALYDYKQDTVEVTCKDGTISIQALYDYKAIRALLLLIWEIISIQALYDYKTSDSSDNYYLK